MSVSELPPFETEATRTALRTYQLLQQEAAFHEDWIYWAALGLTVASSAHLDNEALGDTVRDLLARKGFPGIPSYDEDFREAVTNHYFIVSSDPDGDIDEASLITNRKRILYADHGMKVIDTAMFLPAVTIDPDGDDDCVVCGMGTAPRSKLTDGLAMIDGHPVPGAIHVDPLACAFSAAQMSHRPWDTYDEDDESIEGQNG